MLSVCASSTQEALSITSRLREVIGTTATSEDAYQNDLLVAASLFAETFLGYPLRAQVYSETLAAYDSPRLMVSRTPIRNIVSLTYGTDSGSWTTLASTEYRIENAGAGIIGRDLAFDSTEQQRWSLSPYTVPGSLLRPWFVVYEAGYVAGGPLGPNSTDAWGGRTSTDGGLVAGSRAADGTLSTAPSLPRDIERAILFKAREWYNGDERFTSKRVGDLAFNLRSEAVDGPAEQLLRPYQAIAARA